MKSILILLTCAQFALCQSFNPLPSAMLQKRKGWWGQGTSVGNLPSAWTEISGIATARLPANKGYLWCNVDGNEPNIRAINATTAAAAGIWTASGITLSDVEECDSASVNGQAFLYLFDTGDNANARATIKVLRIKEPTITGSNAAIPGGDVEEITCEYPAGNVPSHKDLEGAFADPHSGDLYFITKRISPILAYRLPHAASYSGTQTLEFLGSLHNDAAFNTISDTISGNNGYVTGASITPNGTEILLRSYSKVWRFPRNLSTQTIYQAMSSAAPAAVEAYVGGGNNFLHPGSEPQGESVCFSPSGLEFYTCSEFVATESSSASAYPLYKFSRLGTAQTTWTFQQGASSYTGTTDTYLDSGAATTSQATAISLVCDWDYSAYPTVSRTRQAMLKFDITSIPTTSTVVQAYLDLYINTEGLGLSLHRILIPWADTDTYNTLTAGIALDNADASAAADFTKGPYTVGQGKDTYTGNLHINLPLATVQSWVTTPAGNHGYCIVGPNESTGDGVQISSEDNATAAQRPTLVIRTIP
jgi:hypothetical protein